VKQPRPEHQPECGTVTVFPISTVVYTPKVGNAEALLSAKDALLDHKDPIGALVDLNA